MVRRSPLTSQAIRSGDTPGPSGLGVHVNPGAVRHRRVGAELMTVTSTPVHHVAGVTKGQYRNIGLPRT